MSCAWERFVITSYSIHYTKLYEFHAKVTDEYAGMNQGADSRLVVPLAYGNQAITVHQADFQRSYQTKTRLGRRQVRFDRRVDATPAGAHQFAPGIRNNFV